MKRKLKIFIAMIILTSCYSDYMGLNVDVFNGAQWNSERSKIAFIASTSAYRKADGISRFPDGGVPNYLKQNVALYIYSADNSKLNKLIEFQDLTSLLGSSRSKYKILLAFTDSLIYYQIKAFSDWKYFDRDPSSQSIAKKYDRFYSYNLSSSESKEVDSLEFFSIYDKLKQSNKIGLNDLSKKLSKIPLSAWDLILQDIYPKDNRAYIEETIYRKNTNKITRQAVIEQIIAPMSIEEISEILIMMEKHAATLQGTDKLNYDLFGKETYEKIRETLENKKSDFM